MFLNYKRAHKRIQTGRRPKPASPARTTESGSQTRKQTLDERATGEDGDRPTQPQHLTDISPWKHKAVTDVRCSWAHLLLDG